MAETKLPRPSALSYLAVVAHLKQQGEFIRQHRPTPAGSGYVRADSRQLQQGDIFIALKGRQHDGNSYLQATPAGLVISEQLDLAHLSVPALTVKSTRRSWSLLCSLALHFPQKNLKIIAVTGTNGKTSTTHMLMQLLTLCAYPPLLISSLGVYHGKHYLQANPLTTPDPDLLYQLLAYARQHDITYVVLEVSSHALALQKLAPLQFHVSIITSFSQDHLDFHPNMQAYFASKWQLLPTHSSSAELVIVQRQVAEWAQRQGLSFTHPAFWTFGTEGKQTLTQAHKHLHIQANILKIQGISAYARLRIGKEAREGLLSFCGEHYLLDFAAALFTTEKILQQRIPTSKWQAVRLPAGRFEVVSRLPLVLVDYAHTPAALQLCLQTLAHLQPLRVVFGCGGERDRSKRREMGAISCRYAEQVLITNDNPRREPAEQIVADILTGCDKEVQVILNRRAALRMALTQARQAGGTVLVAGRGAEAMQEFAGYSEPFDDRQVCRALLEENQ